MMSCSSNKGNECTGRPRLPRVCGGNPGSGGCSAEVGAAEGLCAGVCVCARPVAWAGNAETVSGFIFGSVTACQWLQMRRKGRL